MATAPTPRLLSLDAYRGLIMVALAFQGFGLLGTAQRHLGQQPDAPVWQWISFQFEHVPWVGCSLWDLIQPSFMFMVGVSMPYSYASRRERGDSNLSLWLHVLRRSLVLVFLGIFLISNGGKTTNWFLTNVLTQIGLAYPFVFLFWQRRWFWQLLGIVGITLLTLGLYLSDPQVGVDLETGNPAVGISAEWAQAHLTDVPPAWHKNANAGHALELVILNTLPRKEAFMYNEGGYATVNFLPSMIGMILGLMAGEWLRGTRPKWQQFLGLVLAGGVCLGLGQALIALGIPSIKRIWSPSWALDSAGRCLLILAGLFALIDWTGWQHWSYPLLVVGRNSIAVYCMSMMLKPWVAQTWTTHFGPNVFMWAGDLWQPTVRAVMIGSMFWLIAFWMDRQRIYVRI